MNTDELLKSSLNEIEKVLSTKTVVGEPIKLGENLVVPVVSIGFGFGAGAGEGPSDKGEGGGAGAGGGIKPIAFVIMDKSGDVRIESIKGGTAKAIESVGSVVAQAVQKATEAKKKSA